jgi:hypothetical protein
MPYHFLKHPSDEFFVNLSHLIPIRNYERDLPVRAQIGYKFIIFCGLSGIGFPAHRRNPDRINRRIAKGLTSSSFLNVLTGTFFTEFQAEVPIRITV